VLGSSLVRALFDLYKVVSADSAKLICVSYPEDYMDSLTSLGLTALPGFKLTNSLGEAPDACRHHVAQQQLLTKRVRSGQDNREIVSFRCLRASGARGIGLDLPPLLGGVGCVRDTRPCPGYRGRSNVTIFVILSYGLGLLLFEWVNSGSKAFLDLHMRELGRQQNPRFVVIATPHVALGGIHSRVALDSPARVHFLLLKLKS